MNLEALQSHTIAQHTPMTRRTQLLDGWYQTLLSTGNLRMDEYCDATNHPPVAISHIRMRLKALLTSQSQHPQKALRLSNDNVRFASAAIPQAVLLLYCPFYFFCCVNWNAQRKTITSLFHFFCHLLTRPNSELAKSISRDTRAIFLTDTIYQVAQKLQNRHVNQMNLLDSLITVLNQTLTQNPVTVQTLTLIMQKLIELRQVTTYETLLALTLANMNSKATCSKQILNSIENETTRMTLYAKLYPLRKTLTDYFTHNLTTYKFMTDNYQLLQTSALFDTIALKSSEFPKRPLSSAHTGNSASSSKGPTFQSASNRTQPNLTRFSECFRLLNQIPPSIPTKEVNLRKFQKALNLFYTKVKSCDRDATAASFIYASLLQRCTEEQKMSLTNQAKARSKNVKNNSTDLAYINMYDTLWTLFCESQTRLLDIADNAKKPKSKRSKIRPNITCIFCKASNHVTNDCPSTMHPSMKKHVLLDTKRCLRCFAKMRLSHICHEFCSLCAGAHHRLLCLEKVPPIKIKKPTVQFS